MGNFPVNNEQQSYSRGDVMAFLKPLLEAIIAGGGGGTPITGYSIEAKQKGYSQAVTTGITLTGTNNLVIKNNSLKNTTIQLFTNSITGTGYLLEGSMDGINYDGIALAKCSQLASTTLILNITTTGMYSTVRNDGNFPYLRFRSLLAGNSANIQYSLTENV